MGKKRHLKAKIFAKSLEQKEVTFGIIKLEPDKAPGYDFITGIIHKELRTKVVIRLIHFINAAFRLYPWKAMMTDITGF